MFKKAKQFIKSAADRLSLASDSVMYALLGVMVVVGPLFLIPTRAFPIAASKGYLFILIGIVMVAVYAIKALRQGQLSVPKSLALGMLGLAVVATFIGALAAPSFGVAFFGYGFESLTWVFFALFAVVAVVSFQTFRSLDRIGSLFVGILIPFAVLVLWHLVRFIAGPAVLSFGTLFSSTSTALGSWGDLAAFFGLVALLGTLTLETAPFPKPLRIAVGVVTFLASFFLLFMSNRTVMIVVGLVALASSLYLFSMAYWDKDSQAYKKSRRVPWFSMALFAVALLGIFFGPFLSRVAGMHNTVSMSEIRPSVRATFKAGSHSLARNFVTGYGPNSFSAVWNKTKPVSISGRDVASVDFAMGSGYVPTIFASNGILGTIFWALFFVFLIVALIRGLGRGFASTVERYLTVALAGAVVYLAVVLWVYVPGSYLVLLFAVFAGAFLSLVAEREKVKDITLSFIKDPRTSFFGILGVTVVLVASVLGAYVAVRKMSSFVHYTRGSVLLSRSDLTRGTAEVSRASALAGHDMYHVRLAQLSLARVGELVKNSNAASKEAVSKSVEQAIGLALAHAQAAISYNPNDYRNYALLGTIYQSMVSFGVTDAYERAEAAYKEAEKRNPNDSTMKLLYADLALVKNDSDKALTFVEQSLALQPTKSAYLMKARIEVERKQWSKAADSLSRVMALDPSNVLVYINLGVVLELSGDTTASARIFDDVRKRYTDGDEAILKIRTSYAGPQAPVIVPEEPVVKDIAPVEKKQ